MEKTEKPYPIVRVSVQTEQDPNAGGAFYIFYPPFSSKDYPDIIRSEPLYLSNGKMLVVDYSVDGGIVGVEFL